MKTSAMVLFCLFIMVAAAGAAETAVSPAGPSCPTESLFAASTEGTAECYDECYWYYDRCTSVGCGVPPAEDCLLRCEADLNLCLEQCDACPSVRTYTTIEVTNKVWIGGERCLKKLVGYGKAIFREYEETLKYTTYRETTNCDGTKTTEVVKVQYNLSYCWYQTAYGCTTLEPKPSCTKYQ